MKSLTIGIDFITGRCVAASVSDRDRPEWPPHPGRLYMALAAAVFETGEKEEEVAALKWLESLPAPDIFASEATVRSLVKHYVPVNDKMTENKSVLQSTPGLTRSKQERSYPTTIPFDPTVAYVWSTTEELVEHWTALCTICSNVIRVGHSSSLVSAWAALTDGAELSQSKIEPTRIRWQPVSHGSNIRVRVVGVGEFERLKAAFNSDSIDEFVNLKLMIESTKGKPQQESKKRFEERFQIPYGKNLRAPEPTPASLGLWQGYRRSDEESFDSRVIEGKHFDSELLILTKVDGRNIGIQDGLALTSRLRDASMSQCPVNPAPEWLGGHDPTTGKPTLSPHVAFLALPFVGREYVDAHVMGLALALPKTEIVSPSLRGRLLGPLFYDENGDPKNVNLHLGNLGVWILRLEERLEPPLTLQNQTWVGPSRNWASVTPVVLDRFPKNSISEDRRAWEAEIRETIANSCVRAGLPLPTEIDIDTTGWHIGTPRASSKSRPMRSPTSVCQTARLGDGFPLMAGRIDKPSRPQIHTFLRFDQPVLGPVLIGAGRFLGYGLCKPIRVTEKNK